MEISKILKSATKTNYINMNTKLKKQTKKKKKRRNSIIFNAIALMDL